MARVVRAGHRPIMGQLGLLLWARLHLHVEPAHLHVGRLLAKERGSPPRGTRNLKIRDKILGKFAPVGCVVQCTYLSNGLHPRTPDQMWSVRLSHFLLREQLLTCLFVCSCTKAVYQAELVASDGHSYHKTCFKCVDCNKPLSSSNISHHDDKIYCKGCYGKHFGPGVSFRSNQNFRVSQRARFHRDSAGVLVAVA